MCDDSALPALLGGSPVRLEGPPVWPLPDSAVARLLEQAFADGSWGRYQGVYVPQLEQRLRALHDVTHVLLCGSGTFAVELALRGLRVEPGTEVILGAYDYPGNFLCVHALGALPVLVDISGKTGTLDPAQLEAALSARTRAILVSHLHGGVVPMDAVLEIACRHGIPVLEDAAQMPGALLEGMRAGSVGDVGILSFGGSKLLTAGRGGAVLTNRADVFQRMRSYQLRGNLLCPLSELQAAVLLPQLDLLDARRALRNSNVQRLLTSLGDLTGLQPFAHPGNSTQPDYYKLGFRYDAVATGLSRARFVAALRAEGIAFDEGFAALHIGRSATRFRASGSLPEATHAHQSTVILHHPVLLGSTEDLEQINAGVRKVLRHARELENLG